jgi:hypothetical protein
MESAFSLHLHAALTRAKRVNVLIAQVDPLAISVSREGIARICLKESEGKYSFTHLKSTINSQHKTKIISTKKIGIDA